MKRLAILLLYVYLHLPLCYGQVKALVGSVTDEESGEPVAGAIVQTVGGKNYTITTNDGRFSLKGEARQIRVQSMGYRSIVVDVIESPMHIKMKPEATQLKDVIIKAPDIIQKSDTLVYSMSKWAQKQDRNMADVLRRLPGVEVAEDGGIKYNGEPINKFYIDGSDFVNDRYGVATNNISPDDVASVEIMENHQPVKVLEGLEFSQQAGLNIKLKETARARWIGILNGGIGAEPLLYDASLFAMRIARKWQNMETLRLNDTGWNPNSQSQRHTDYTFLSSGYNDNPWPDYIAIGTTSAPLDELRTRDNLSFLAQSSNARHVADGFDVKLNATYQADRLDFTNSCTTRYFDKNIPSFLEQNTMRSREHQLNGEWSLQLNRRNNYLKDNLSVDAQWNRATSAVSGTQTLRQQSDLPSLDITNDLQLVRRLDSHLLTISSYNRYTHRPHSLTADSVLQDLTTDDFRSVTEARYGWILHRWSFYARGGIDFNLHRFQSSLSGLMLPDYPSEGRRRSALPLCSAKNFTILKTYASPEARYQHRRWWITLSLPIGYYYYHVADRLADTSTDKHFMTVSPMFYVRHQLTAKTDLTAYLNYSLQPVAPSSYTQTVIMSDFRNLTFQTPSAERLRVGASAGMSIRQRSAFVRLRYRNPITSLFANLSAKYEQDYQPLMQNQLFIENRILNEFVALGNNVSITQLNGGISKGLWSAKITVGIDASFGHSSAKMMRQNVEQPYTSTFITLAPKFTGKFTRWLSTDYRLTYTNNQYDVDAVKAIHSALRQNLSITFLPTDQWHIAFGAEHYFMRFSTDQTASITFLDASVRWLLSKRIDLALAATNLLDETDYRYTSFGSLSESLYSFSIRPRNIIIRMQVKI